jgi:hypothetical protein
MKKTKAAKAAEYFLKYPNATPKDVGARFSMHLPQVYAVRKRVLSGSMLGEVGNPQVTTEAATQTADLQQVGGNTLQRLVGTTLVSNGVMDDTRTVCRFPTWQCYQISCTMRC